MKSLHVCVQSETGSIGRGRGVVKGGGLFEWPTPPGRLKSGTSVLLLQGQLMRLFMTRRFGQVTNPLLSLYTTKHK